MKSIFQLARCYKILFIVLNLSTIEDSLQAQWIQTITPYSASIQCFTVSDTNLFAGTYDGGVFLSTNNGSSWNVVNDGLTNIRVSALAVSGMNLFAGTGSGVFLSTNNGRSWTAVIEGLTDISVRALAVSGTNLFAGTYSGIFLSTNNGANWTPINNGLTYTSVSVLATNGTNLFAGTFAGGVFLSTNNGTSWTPVNTGLKYNIGMVSTYTHINAFAFTGTNVIVGTADGAFRSTNNGASWTEIDSGLTNKIVCALTVSGTNLFAGIYGGGVSLSINNGTSWTTASTGLTNKWVNTLALFGTNLFTGTEAALPGASGNIFKRPLSEMITSVEKNSYDLPIYFILNQNYPNPFNPTTNISFSLSARSFVSLKVFDVLGRERSVVLSEELSAGNYTRQWNAKYLPSGVYFYQLRVGSFTDTKKLVLLR